MIQRRNEASQTQPLYGGEGAVTMEWYFPRRSALGTTVMRYELAPGSAEGIHLHLAGDDRSCTTGSIDELYVVTAGEVVATVQGHASVLRAGDAMYAPAGSEHGIENHSTEPAEVILVFGRPSNGDNGSTPLAAGRLLSDEGV